MFDSKPKFFEKDHKIYGPQTIEIQHLKDESLKEDLKKASNFLNEEGIRLNNIAGSKKEKLRAIFEE